MFRSLARLHGNDLSKCLLSELTFWWEKSGICNVNTTYTGCIANAQTDYPPVRKWPSHPWLLGKGFWNPFVIIITSSSIIIIIIIIYSFILFFLQAPHIHFESSPAASAVFIQAALALITWEHLNVWRGCLLMSPCQVALATINGLDRRVHIIFNVFQVIKKT